MYMSIMPSKSWSRRIYETVGGKHKKMNQTFKETYCTELDQ